MASGPKSVSFRSGDMATATGAHVAVAVVRASMSDWTPLRGYLRADFGLQPDEIILNDPDREARALLAWHRERALNMLTDQAELIEEPAPAPSVVPLKLNGHRGHA
jgi:hypothetical protein